MDWPDHLSLGRPVINILCLNGYLWQRACIPTEHAGGHSLTFCNQKPGWELPAWLKA